MSYYWPIILIVASNVIYHITAKSVPQTINPLAMLSVTYVCSAALALALYFFSSPVRMISSDFNWVMGVGVSFDSTRVYNDTVRKCFVMPN